MRKLYGASVHTLHYHHQAIKKLAKPLKVTMVDAKDGTIEGVQHKTLPVIGIQYHPDRMYVKANPGIRKSGKIVIEYFFDICYDLKMAGEVAPANPDTPSTEPAPADPTPSDPTPSDPATADPTPDNPIPDNPTPSDPTPDNPTPSDPTPDSPTPSDPTPDNPTPSDPTPDNPTADSPAPADETDPQPADN